MCILTVVAVLGSMLSGSAVLTGQVVDEAGVPVGGARVFLEMGLAGAVVETRADVSGTFKFNGVPAMGVGVFAVAEGMSFGGVHLILPTGEKGAEVSIVLRTPDHIRGKVVNAKGKVVKGAKVARVALLGVRKVSIPLAKLEAFGFAVPVTNSKGAFAVASLPKGSEVALKFSHRAYAHEAINNVPVGEEDLRVVMSSGAVLRGTVTLADRRTPVAKAAVTVRYGHPPYDSVIAATDHKGGFELRVKPGAYLCQVSAGRYVSQGWRKVLVGLEGPVTEVQLHVAGVGAIKGRVRDAATGKPIADAVLRIESGGNLAVIARTNSKGFFEAALAQGHGVVRLAAPAGYASPETEAVAVRVAEDKVVELPDFWLAPIPVFHLRVVDSADRPAPGVAVRILRPMQFGWHVADEEGRVELKLASLPRDTMVVGMVESPWEAVGALFRLKLSEAPSATVKLLPLASVSGRVVHDKEAALAGAVVGALFPDEEAQELLLLWRVLTSADGRFVWPSVAPHVPLRCVAYAGEDHYGQSTTFNLKESENRKLGDLTVRNGTRGKSMLGRKVNWRGHELIAGSVSPEDTGKPAVVVFCAAEEAGMVQGGLSALSGLYRNAVVAAVGVDGRPSGLSGTVPVFKGKAPATATTYVLDGEGKVVLETFGLPPLAALQGCVVR